MKKKYGLLIALAIVVFIGLIMFSSTIVVTNQNEYNIVRKFGKIVRIEDKPGLTFKSPIESVDSLPNNLLLYNLAPSDVITKDKKTMIADCYILWKITDPIKFIQSLNGNISNAEGRINTIVYNAVKNTISNMTQDSIIKREENLNDSFEKYIEKTSADYGFEITSIDIKKFDLPDDNKNSVYNRMISERDNVASTYVAEGKSEAMIIKNSTDKEVQIIVSEANKKAEILIAEGESEYMKILADAYNTDSRAEFYNFVRSLDSLKLSMKGNNKTIILSKDSPIAEIFYIK